MVNDEPLKKIRNKERTLAKSRDERKERRETREQGCYRKNRETFVAS